MSATLRCLCFGFERFIDLSAALLGWLLVVLLVNNDVQFACLSYIMKLRILTESIRAT